MKAIQLVAATSTAVSDRSSMFWIPSELMRKTTAIMAWLIELMVVNEAVH